MKLSNDIEDNNNRMLDANEESILRTLLLR